VHPPSPTPDSQRRQDAPPARGAWSLILFALLFPSLVTWVYFVALADAPPAAQLAAAGLGKAVQFALPVVWVFWICRQRPRWRRPQRGDLLAGAATGLAIAAAMAGLYFGGVRNWEMFAGAAGPIREKVAGLGIDALWKYLLLTVFYALAHSLLEEYYWRWFVFGELRRLTPAATAVAVSSLGFAAHHVIVLGRYFGYGSILTWLFALGVAVGGVIWAVQFERTKSLWGIWLSHLLVDAAIFLIGLDLVGASLS